MLITLGVCLGFGFWQLWDLRRERIKDAAKAAAKEAAQAASAGEGARSAVRLSSDAAS
ncbi:MAG: hypothetical protein ACK4VM_14320 [Bosea sp. (in: a-proteobacteria)]